jgi:hypothetical protein
VQRRIEEILNDWRDLESGKEWEGRGVTEEGVRPIVEGRKRLLRAELRILSRKEVFLANHRQAGISLWVGTGSVLVGIAAVIASIWIPAHQRTLDEQSEIEAAYKNMVTNQDIFIANSNTIGKLTDSKDIADLPESYLETQISEGSRKKIQDTFGLVQYRFFLYYLQQTALLNEEIAQMRYWLITIGSRPISELNATKPYLSSMEYLLKEGAETRFNYQRDTECLQYIFEQSFEFIDPDGRGEILECSSDSLDRIFNFGYFPEDTPAWLRPELRRALNNREPGLGDRLIDI